MINARQSNFQQAGTLGPSIAVRRLREVPALERQPRPQRVFSLGTRLQERLRLGMGYRCGSHAFYLAIQCFRLVHALRSNCSQKISVKPANSESRAIFSSKKKRLDSLIYRSHESNSLVFFFFAVFFFSHYSRLLSEWISSIWIVVVLICISFNIFSSTVRLPREVILARVIMSWPKNGIEQARGTSRYWHSSTLNHAVCIFN